LNVLFPLIVVETGELTKEELKQKGEEIVNAIEAKSWIGRSSVGLTLKDIVAKFEEDIKKFEEGSLIFDEQSVFYLVLL